MKKTFLLLALTACGDSTPPKNYAIAFAKIQRPSIECVSLGEGWGFIPDSAVCVVTDDNNKPAAYAWCRAGGSFRPECVLVVDPNAGHPQPAKAQHP